MADSYHDLIIIDGKLEASLSEQVFEYEERLKRLKYEYDDLKKLILSAMEAKGILKLETDDVTITYVGKTDRETLDSKTLKAELPDVYDAYVKISPVKPSIRIKVK